MSLDLHGLQQAVAMHGRVGRIVIVDHKGSAPREAGASMLVWSTGQSGTIGGGALEFEAVNALRARLASNAPELSHIALGPALNQCCGGAVSLLSEVFDKNTLPESGTRRIFGTKLKPIAIRRQERRARNGEGGTLTFENGWLFEPLRPSTTPLWVYGAGHVGRAIVCVMAPMPDFAVTWIDTDPNRYPEVIPPSVTALPAPNPAASVALAPPDAAHLILTYSHTLDLELCHQLLQHGFGFAGLIGSKTKWARFRSRLADLGHDSAQISRICCPIGQPELGKHPQAIALGVASQLLRQREGLARGGRATA